MVNGMGFCQDQCPGDFNMDGHTPTATRVDIPNMIGWTVGRSSDSFGFVLVEKNRDDCRISRL